MNKRPEKTRLSTVAGEAAEVAIEALAWLAADEARLERFLSISGLGPQNLRKAASQPSFLAAILDYLASDEALLVQFAGDSGRRPEDVARAHAAYRGPDAGAYS
jgi:Protein of unknown function (DUF3572)